jgi:hypothetical protein
MMGLDYHLLKNSSATTITAGLLAIGEPIQELEYSGKIGDHLRRIGDLE